MWCVPWGTTAVTAMTSGVAPSQATRTKTSAVSAAPPPSGSQRSTVARRRSDPPFGAVVGVEVGRRERRGRRRRGTRPRAGRRLTRCDGRATTPVRRAPRRGDASRRGTAAGDPAVGLVREPTPRTADPARHHDPQPRLGLPDVHVQLGRRLPDRLPPRAPGRLRPRRRRADHAGGDRRRARGPDQPAGRGDLDRRPGRGLRADQPLPREPGRDARDPAGPRGSQGLDPAPLGRPRRGGAGPTAAGPRSARTTGPTRAWPTPPP